MHLSNIMLFSLIVLVATGILITSFTVIQTLFCDGKGTHFEKIMIQWIRLRNFSETFFSFESFFGETEFQKDVAWLNMEANQNPSGRFSIHLLPWFIP